MRRTTLNFLVDAVALMLMAGMIATGLIVRNALPPGTGGRVSIWGMSRHDWGDLHFYVAIGLLVLLLVHLSLHWFWTYVIANKLFASIGSPQRKETAASSRPSGVRRTVIGCVTFAMLVGLIGGFYWLATQDITTSESGTNRRRAQADERPPGRAVPTRSENERGNADIRGSMTIVELADRAGVSAERLKLSLGLPADVPDDMRLGRVRREYGLSMSQIRDAVASLPDSMDDP